MVTTTVVRANDRSAYHMKNTSDLK